MPKCILRFQRDISVTMTVPHCCFLKPLQELHHLLVNPKKATTTALDEVSHHSPNEVLRNASLSYFTCLNSETKLNLGNHMPIAQVQAEIIVLEDDNVPKAILKYISNNRISKLVMGSSSRNIIARKLKGHDLPTNIALKAPKFCFVYVISKGKLALVHARTTSTQDNSRCGDSRNHSTCSSEDTTLSRGEGVPETSKTTPFQSQQLISHRNGCLLSQSKSDSMNIVVDLDKEISRSHSNGVDMRTNPAYSIGRKIDVLEAVDISDSSTSTFSRNLDAIGEEIRSFTIPDSQVQVLEGGWNTKTTTTYGSGKLSFDNNRRKLQGSGLDLEEIFVSKPDIKNEIQRIREMYRGAFEEAISVECKAEERNVQLVEELCKLEAKRNRETYKGARAEAISAEWKVEYRNSQMIEKLCKLEEAKVREELARSVALQSKANCEGAMKDSKARWKATLRELKQRRDVGLRAIRESYESKKAKDALESADQRCRRYSIEQIESSTNFFSESLKIGEGGYGPVYKDSLDYTIVAIKVLQTETAKGRHEFQKEVEVLSRIHHPHTRD